MIYQRFGSPVTITAHCGMHRPHGFASPVTLVRVQYPQHESYPFAEFLKADEGWAEIAAAVEGAPVVTLTGVVLRDAIVRAL